MRDWLPVTQPAGLSLIPFCVEEGGRFGDGCYQLIDLFSIALNSLASDKAASRTHALRRLYLTNQRGIARHQRALTHPGRPPRRRLSHQL